MNKMRFYKDLLMRYLKLSFTGFLAAALLPTLAFAVPAVVVPPSAQPSRTDKQLSIENERPEVGGPVVITVTDQNGHRNALKGDVTFVLKDIKFENLTAFTKEDLLPLYSDDLDKKVSLETINDIADKITAHYRNAGYILSRAMVPPQSVSGGVVTIKIVEGYINNVTILGDKNASGLLADYVEKIRAAKPLDVATLERYLLLMQDLPGINARAVLSPATGVQGASDVAITITEKKLDGSLSLDNRGTRYLGPIEEGATAGLNDMFGLYDRTQLHGTITGDPREMQFYQFSHDEQLDSEGTKLTVSASRTHTEPGYRLEAFDVSGIDTLYSAAVSHPFLRSRKTNIYGNVSFDIRDTDSDAAGQKLYQDRLHVGRIGGSYDFVDSTSAINRVEAQLSKGFGWDDNTGLDLRSRIGGRTDFWKGTMQASRLQPISGPFSAYVATTGQIGSAELLTAEQFGLGGVPFNSAYDPSEVTGDSGVDGRFELQYSNTTNFKYLPTYELYSFYDIGEVWVRNPSAGVHDSTSLASAGLGSRFNVSDPVSGSVELAVPMTHEVAANAPNHGNDARLFFSLAARF